jgi:hypothetical protein
VRTGSPDRNAVMQALFNQVSGAQLRAGGNAFVTTVRGWQDIQQVSEAERPALFMLEDDQDAIRPRAGMPPRRLLMRVQFLIYAWSGGQTTEGGVPASVIQPLIDAVDDALNPGPLPLGIQQQTLGGLAYDAFVSGRIQVIPGYRDGQALAVIPVQVLVP